MKLDTGREKVIKRNKLHEIIEKDLTEYGTLLEKAFKTDEDRRINTLERERYRYFNQVADRLVDNLLVWVDDYLGELKRVGLTDGEALKRIPEYGASWKILERPDGKVYFISEGNKHGHSWEPEDMEFLITRLSDPLLKEQLHIAGITEDARMLVGIDERITALLSQGKTGISLDLLNNIRKIRHHICLGVHVLYINIGTEKLHKSHRHISVYDIISDIIEMKEERKRAEKFSYNDFSHSVFKSLVDKIKEPIMNDKGLVPKIREDFEKEFGDYATAFEAFRSHPLWDELDAYEADLYRNMETLVFSIAAHLGCIGADEPGRWEKHVETDTYKAALALIDSIPQKWYDNLKQFDRGESLSPHIVNAMLDTWDDVVHRVSLKILDRETLFNTCKSADKSARLLAGKIHRDRELADLDKLRFARYRLVIIIHVSHIVEKV
jgi:hypothetical protein